MQYDVFTQSVQGYGHIKRKQACEDYGIKKETHIGKIFAVADGHGDRNCPRSQIGSRLICEICVSELDTFSKNVEHEGWVEKLFNENEVEALIRQLILSIFGKWVCAVNDHHEHNPLSEDEYSSADEYAEQYRRGEKIEHIYGTTLICGLITDQYLLLMQQGDGRCVVFDKDGNASQPVPWDDRCFANVTTSLCDPDAVQSCRYHIIDLSQNPIIACVMGSDGVEDSFSTFDKMYVYYRQLLIYACKKGTTALEKQLLNTLPAFSENGSGDDTTISGIIDIKQTKKFVKKFEKENSLVEIDDDIRIADNRIVSMSAKLSFLKKKYEDALLKYTNEKQNYDDVCAEYSDVTEKLAELDTAKIKIDFFDFDITIMKSNDGVIEDQAESVKEEDEQDEEPRSRKKIKQLRKTQQELEKHKEEAQKKLALAEADKIQVEAEYLPYKEKYDALICVKEDAVKERDAIMNGDQTARGKTLGIPQRKQMRVPVLRIKKSK